MKNMKKIFICLVVLFSFSMVVNAACNDEELNEWATTVEAKFIEITDLGIDSSEYAYLLTIDPLRDDIILKAKDGSGATAEGKMLSPGIITTVDEETGNTIVKPKDSIQAIGCYTNDEEETYTIEVYGAKNSACPNQLLKTLNYTVPRFNRYIKSKYCENNDNELCKTFTNATKDMTNEEFEKAVKKTSPDNGEGGTSKFLSVILEYGLYILIPLVIVAIIYGIRINKVKKEERDR